METENNDWKPEVGKTAWILCGETVYEAVVCRKNYSSYEQWYMGNDAKSEYGFGWMDSRDIFPSAEAALASIKVYDLEGNEIMVSRDRDFKWRSGIFPKDSCKFVCEVTKKIHIELSSSRKWWKARVMYEGMTVSYKDMPGEIPEQEAKDLSIQFFKEIKNEFNARFPDRILQLLQGEQCADHCRVEHSVQQEVRQM